MKAEKVSYLTWLHTEKSSKQLPVSMIYIPSEKLLVKPTPNTDASLTVNYDIIIGSDAESMYESIIKMGDLKNSIKEIDVDSKFIGWANSMYNAKNPPESVINTLKPTW